MSAKVTIRELEEGEKYQLVKRLSYDEIPDFVIEHLFHRNGVMTFYWLSVVLSLLLLVRPTVDFFGSSPGFLRTAGYALLGLVIFPLLLAPLHEGIHAVVLLLAGVRSLRAGIDLRHSFIYITAHRQPVTRRPFQATALAPFLVLNAALLAAAWLIPGRLSWSLYLTLFVHTTMCAGDFALLSFYASLGPGEVITYDDVDEQTSYFFVEKD